MTTTAFVAQVPTRWSMRAIVLAWTPTVALGAVYAAVSLRMSGQLVTPWKIIVGSCAAWYVWALMTPVIERLAERQRVERPLRPGVVATHALAGIAACAVQALATTLTTMLISSPPGVAIPQLFVFWFLTLLPAGVVVYAAVVGVRTAELHRAESIARARTAEQLSEQLGLAQLNALRSQLQPHFLFNTLNAVIALVRERENEQAAEALLMLSELLRTSLRTSALTEIPLDEELCFTERYLAIERLRFGDRITVSVHAPEQLRRAAVPTFLLQPFVENALKHGLRNRRDGGRVVVDVRADEAHLFIRVEDDGVGLSSDWQERCRSGHSIASTRERLAGLYGSNASLHLAPRKDGDGTVVDIAIPLRVATGDSATAG